MDTESSDSLDDLPSAETPNDVAVLYSWANLHGAKYRDSSALRREYRAQVSDRAAEQVQEGEPHVHAENAATTQPEHLGCGASESARRTSAHLVSARHVEPKASSLTEARRGQASALAMKLPSRRRPELKQSHPIAENGSNASAPEIASHPNRARAERSAADHLHGAPATIPKRRRQDFLKDHSTEADSAIETYRRRDGQPAMDTGVTSQEAELRSARITEQCSSEVHAAAPAWMYPPHKPQIVATRSRDRMTTSASRSQGTPTVDTLQRSRELVASSWYALKGVFAEGASKPGELVPARQKETQTPILAIFSVAGGVGKTSLVATLGRALSSLGEKVLLTDTTSHGLLPFYFGASELHEGAVRTFSPPSGSTDAPVYLLSCGGDKVSGTEETHGTSVDEIVSSGSGTHRILLDLTSYTGELLRQLGDLNPTVLVPLAPDMNSVISLRAVEKFLDGLKGADGTPLNFFYLLNQFDAALPLHLDIREVLKRQLGERLLPFVIRRSPAVSEALAQGMTIIDYAPDAPVVEDYLNVAAWIRTQATPSNVGLQGLRWSER